MEASRVQTESVLIRDASKRKRVNRNAKLKQFKLDARREQWLSQGKTSVGDVSPNSVFEGPKGVDEHNGSSTGDSDAESCVINQDDLCDGQSNGLCNYKSVSKSISCSSHKGDTDFVHGGSPVELPVLLNPSDDAKKTGKNKSKGKRRSGRVKCKVDKILDSNSKDSENNNNQDEDDWEAAADALDCQMNLNKDAASEIGSSSKAGILKTPGVLKSDSVNISGRPLSTTKAWKADDTFRPASLPRIIDIQQRQQHQQQHKQQQQQQQPPLLPLPTAWTTNRGFSTIPSTSPPPAPAPAPVCCPICTEELDDTDSSFLPCSCGFRLCLFCHHRIAADDGRCPGCRKFYSKMPQRPPPLKTG